MLNALHVAATYLESDARVKSYLSILKDDGWNVDVISYGGDNLPSFEEIDGIGVYRVSSRYRGKCILKYLLSYRRFYTAARKLAKRLHKERGYRFVHVHNMPNFLVGIASVLKPKPTILLDMHDVMSINFKTKFGNNSFANRVIRFEENWSISKADELICADKGQKQILMQMQKGINTTVIMNLANSQVFKWSDHSWHTGIFRFVYHGTIAKRLGVDRVIEALRYLPENVVFRLIGDGDEKENILKLIKQYDLDKRVEIYPAVRVEALSELLFDCHAGIIPSRKTEATNSVMLPVKLLEYSALGIPSVVSRLENIELHFKDNQVLYFNPESQESLQQAMYEMQNTKSKRESILLGIGIFNQDYSWESSSNAYRSLIEYL